MADATSTPDAGTVTDASVGADAGEAIDVQAADAASADTGSAKDTGGKICPGPTKPPVGFDAGVVPEPDVSTCKWSDPDFFKGAKPPAETLAIQIGQVDSTGTFNPFVPKQWVGMDHGIQGGFHLTLAFRFKLPGNKDPILKVQIEPYLYGGCELQGFGNAPVVYPKAVAGDWFQFGNKLNPGIQVRFGVPGVGKEVKSSSSFDFCNEWYEMRVAVRDMKSGKWGSTSVRLRTYDTKAN